MTQDFVGAVMISSERIRQVIEKHYTSEHDDREHEGGDLLEAAISYTFHALWQIEERTLDTTAPSSIVWPWGHDAWKPSESVVTNLVKAGALIAAQIDLLLRKESA